MKNVYSLRQNRRDGNWTKESQPMKFWLPLAAGILFATSFATPAFAQATTARVSVATSGMEGNSGSFSSSISADGRYVAFDSTASNLVLSDTNGVSDVLVRDRLAGTTTRVSVADLGTEGNSYSYSPAISADGRYVTFESDASNLVDGDVNGVSDVFVRDTLTGTTRLVSVATDGTQGNDTSYNSALSADGRYATFFSTASNLVTGDTNALRDVFVRDLVAGTTRRVSVATDGSEGNGDSNYSTISADGRYIAFDSTASNLVSGDTNGDADSFVRDTEMETTTRVSVATDGAQGNGGSGYGPSISADGRRIAFFSDASNLVSGDANGVSDVFVRDTLVGTTVRVSVATGGAQGNSGSTFSCISADGRFVVYASYASNQVAGDANAAWDVFVRDTAGETTQRVSVATAGTEGNSFSHYGLSINADGRYVAFESNAINLVTGDANTVRDVFVRGPLPIRYTAADIAQCLRIVAGMAVASTADMTRFNVEPTGGEVITLPDAVLIARKVGGLELNP
jgi:Tol biopolymer transport system component